MPNSLPELEVERAPAELSSNPHALVKANWVASDLERRPIRDATSTTYTGAIETAELFGRRLYAEPFQRGWDRAQKKVVLGDGAE
jgi:hypothetical protein